MRMPAKQNVSFFKVSECMYVVALLVNTIHLVIQGKENALNKEVRRMRGDRSELQYLHSYWRILETLMGAA